jgi:ADP-ribosyl-[dinitrogen reductase] hydrolase
MIELPPKKDPNRCLGAFVGLVVGDAVGAPLEFSPRGSFNPIDGMIEGGYFKIKTGEWTDDSSMALCLADSLLHMNGFDAKDQMDHYSRWFLDGLFSCRAEAFGMGQTFMNSIINYHITGDPFSGMSRPKRPGNGCIMRLAPIPIFYYPDIEKIINYAGESSKTTHGMPESIFASRLFGEILALALAGKSKEEILFGSQMDDLACPEIISGIAHGNYRSKSESEIESTFFAGKCLEAALWCFLNTDNFRDAILRAVNLGGDADSTAAVCGQVAGAYYGVDSIPQNWKDSLAKKELIFSMAQRLLEH